MPFYENQPTIYPLYRLLEELLRGEIQVPRFQRPGTEVTWKPEQRGDLLDSIHRGFPIGTILLWSTQESVGTLDIVGGAQIPPPPTRQRLRLVLDGHQRLSTLVAILGPSLDGYQTTTAVFEERWVYEISDRAPSLERDRFLVPKLKLGQHPSKTQVPLNIVLDRVKLNNWLRDRPKLTTTEVRRADNLRDRFREYSVPVASLVTESLDEATESFQRINSGGTPMGVFHMVTALAYSSGFDPQERFEILRGERLEPLGWRDLGNTDMLRVCAGLVRSRLNDASQHPSKINVRALASSLQAHPEIIERAAQSLQVSIEVLAKIGVHRPAILPYSWQLIVLAIVAGGRNTPHFLHSEQSALERWFWLTTYGGVFGGVNGSVVDRASRALQNMLTGGDWEPMRRDAVQQLGEAGRSDFRAARSKACFLQMARHADHDQVRGPSHVALGMGVDSVGTLLPKEGRSSWFNLVIETSAAPVKDVRQALRDRVGGQTSPEQDALLRRLGVEPGETGSVEELLQLRRSRLIKRERAFVEALGLAWA